MDIKYEFVKTNGAWADVLDDARSTVSKNSLHKEPTKRFKKAMLLAEHSVIRDLIIRWKWIDIPSFVATHFSRHKFEKFISTRRTDRTGIDRTKLFQDEPVSFTGTANAQQILDMMRKRLCGQASKETRQYAFSLKNEIAKIEPELAHYCVPNCIYRCGCPEEKPCGLWEAFCKNSGFNPNMSINDRYDKFNEWINGGRKIE